MDNKHLPVKSKTAIGGPRRANTISQIELNNLLVDTIRQKRENPFWAPKKNTELFKVKEILRGEHQIKKRGDIAQPHYKSNINTYYHRKHLLEGILTEEDSYEPGKTSKQNLGQPNLTQTGQPNQTKHQKNQSYTSSGFYLTEQKVDPSATTRVLKKMTLDRNKKDDKSLEEESATNKLLRDKCNTLLVKEDTSVKKFIEKTRDIILMKYSTKVKQERVVRLNETYGNEVEQYRDRIFTLEQSKALFKSEFFNKYEDYVKTLRDQRDREKFDIQKLIDTKNELDGKVKQLENKISKNKEKIAQFLEYKKFMLQIKEHNVNISEEGLGTIEREEIANENSHDHERDSSFKVSDGAPHISIFKSITNIAKAKKSKIIKPAAEKLKNIDIHNQFPTSISLDTITNPIFDKPEDLVDELKKLEMENLVHLSKLNTAFDNENDAVIEVEKFVKKEKIEHANIVKEISKKDEEHKRLKSRNDALLAEVANLDEGSNDVDRDNEPINYNFYNEDDDQINGEMVLSKIFKLYRSCMGFYLKEKKDDEYVSIYNNIMKMSGEDLKESQMDMLRFIERFFFYIDKRYKEFKLTKTAMLEELERKLDKERKNKFAQAQKNIVVDKIKILAEILKKKDEKIVLPIRKVRTKLKPIEKNKRANSFALQQKSQQVDEFFIR